MQFNQHLSVFVAAGYEFYVVEYLLCILRVTL